MVIHHRTRQIWSQIHPLLTTYDGSLTEVAIIGLPISSLSHAIQRAAESLQDARFLNQQVSPGEYRELPFSPDLIPNLTLEPLVQLRGGLGPEESFQIWFEVYEEDGSFDVELIFDNLTSFSPDCDREMWWTTLQTYLALAAKIRGSHWDIKVFVAPECSGPARQAFCSDVAILIEI